MRELSWQVCLQEDKENFCNSVRAEVKSAGILDSILNCWAFFIDKVYLPPPPSPSL